MVCGVLKAERRDRIQPRHSVVYRCTCHFETGGAFLSADEMLVRRTAKRAKVRIKADHVEPADQTNMLFVFHGSLLGRVKATGTLEIMHQFRKM
jgi:hypothetical protein